MAIDVEINEKVTGDKRKIISMGIKNEESLYQFYMPFVKNGGLFIRTSNTYELGEEIFLLLQLLADPEKFDIKALVAWITPQCAQEGRNSGIGVQFLGEDAVVIRGKIEALIAGKLKSDQVTDTM